MPIAIDMRIVALHNHPMTSDHALSVLSVRRPRNLRAWRVMPYARGPWPERR
jgi:hypothetical protein